MLRSNFKFPQVHRQLQQEMSSHVEIAGSHCFAILIILINNNFINLIITLYYEVDDIIKSCHPPHNHVINLNKNLLVKLFPIQAEVPSARDCQIYTAQGGWVYR